MYKYPILVLIYFFGIQVAYSKNISSLGKVKFFTTISAQFEVTKKINSIYILKSQNLSYLYSCKKCEFFVGDIIYFRAQIFPFKHKLTPSSFDYSYYINKYSLVGSLIAKSNIEIMSRDTNIIREIRRNFIKFIGNNSDNPLSLALLTGNKAQIPKDLYDNFRITGAAHILAISGLHIGGIALIFFLLSRKLLALSSFLSLKYNNKRIALVFSYLFSLFFLFIADFPISGQRALIFLTIIYLGVFFNLKIAPINLILISIIILLLIDYNYFFHPGFQMSIAAMAVICKFLNRRPFISLKQDRDESLERLIRKKSLLNKIYNYEKEIFIISIYISMAILPITIYHFGSSSLISPITNLVVIPLVTLVIMPFGICSLFSALINLETIFFPVFDNLLNTLIQIVTFFSNYAVITPNYIELNDYSLIITLCALTVFLISSSYRIEILSIFLYFSAFLIGEITSTKPDISLIPDRKTFIAKESEGRFIMPNKKISNYHKKELNEYWDNLYSIDHKSYQGQYLQCTQEVCQYKKNGKIINIIMKKLSFQRFHEICNSSNIVVNLSNDWNACYSTLTINNFNLRKFGTINFYTNKKRIKIKNL